jgi:isopentenyl diphosphate isomerase/L-lactate dehydrogenase-like FMN-dependent dehydrogenase
MVFDYIEGGADDEFTVRANAEAFTRWQFTPRVLVDVSHRSLQIDLLGQTLSLPLLLAPTGMAGFASPEGELAAARAAETHGTRLVVSTASAYSLEEIGAGTQGSHWFQLYPWGDRGLMTELVQRAQVAGFHALCVTVDVPVTGNRERDRRNGFTTRPRVSLRGGVDLLRHPGWWSSYLRNRRFQMRNLTSGGTRDALASIQRFSDLFNPQVTWEDLAWLRQLWNGPLLVKGLSHADDAALAVSAGVDAVIVSNHGGRQLDGAAPALVQLPSIVDRVGGSVPILIDGGIRRGTDVVKALCLGATACLIGRPYLYGLAAGGRSGVESVLRCFESEIDTTLALLGCASVRDLHAGLVQPGPA